MISPFSQTCQKLFYYYDPDNIWTLALEEKFGEKWESLWELYADLNNLQIENYTADFCRTAVVYRFGLKF